MPKKNGQLLYQMRRNAHDHKSAGKSPSSDRKWHLLHGFERLFTLASAFLVFALLLPANIVAFLKTAPEALSEISTALYSADSWVGVYSNSPQGYVDVPNSEFTEDTDLMFTFHESHGNLLMGDVRGQVLCFSGAVMSQALLFAEVRLGGETADLELVEFIGGYKIVLAKGIARKDGIFLNIEMEPVALDDPKQFISKPLRLGLHPNDSPEDELTGFNARIYPCDPTIPMIPNTSGASRGN